MTRLSAVLAVLFLAAASRCGCAAPLDRGDLMTFPTRNGVTQSVFIEAPSANPAWVIALFPGSPGALHLDAKGPTTLKGNFVIRTAHYWVDQGDAVALVDTPSDHQDSAEGMFRLSEDSFADTRAIVAALRQRFPNSKLALIATSAGTLSVGNALARDPGIADAFVLTSPVTVANKGTPGLANVDLANVKNGNYRVMVVSNTGDRCVASPAYAAKRFAQTNGFDYVEVESSDGSDDRHAQCQAHSPHGFLGIEEQVLGDANEWLAGKAGAAR